MPYYTRLQEIDFKYSIIPVGWLIKSGIRGYRTQSEFYDQTWLSDREYRSSHS